MAIWGMQREEIPTQDKLFSETQRPSGFAKNERKAIIYARWNHRAHCTSCLKSSLIEIHCVSGEKTLLTYFWFGLLETEMMCVYLWVWQCFWWSYWIYMTCKGRKVSIICNNTVKIPYKKNVVPYLVSLYFFFLS